MQLIRCLYETRASGSSVDIKSVIKISMDALATSFTALHGLAVYRRSCLRPAINPQFRAIWANVGKEYPELLFGSDLTQRLKDIKETGRIGATINQKPSTSHGPSF